MPPPLFMNKIPITFTHEGKEYSGTLDEVFGAASAKTWHLTIDKRYWGKLRHNDRGWFFDPTPHDPWLEGFAQMFGERVELWYG